MSLQVEVDHSMWRLQKLKCKIDKISGIIFKQTIKK
jgi:hypothetical protein